MSRETFHWSSYPILDTDGPELWIATSGERHDARGRKGSCGGLNGEKRNVRELKRETGAAVENSTPMPSALRPGGNGTVRSMAKAWSCTHNGIAASSGIE